MNRLLAEEILEMFAKLELASEEERRRYRDLVNLGSTETPTEQFTRIDCTTDIPPEPRLPDAKLA